MVLGRYSEHQTSKRACYKIFRILKIIDGRHGSFSKRNKRSVTNIIILTDFKLYVSPVTD